ncbi:ricin-type beta-trefoil lectin domain protein [Dyella subtropica]|uniref:ricin-type beta-trefoil lectin domain protein n=1 Tax=Dyella subtropica TaxID=2992127 RepID=UPI00225262CF|nr:ricin-type beta-trefoil lectin domain protein [Dyella subtropica]
MKATKGLCSLLMLLILPFAAQAGDTPGTYTHYQFAPSVTALDSVDYGITVQTDPGYRADVYWSNQFSLVGTGSGGYTGMQSNGGSHRMFLFSIWDATEAKPGSEGSYCVSFGGEGVGKSCRMAHEWQQGHTYRFHVAYEGDQWLGVTVTDLATGGSFKLGSIRTASNGISPHGMVNWTEYFEWSSANANCFNQPYASAAFDLPRGNGGNAVASISGTSLSKTCTGYSQATKTASGSVQRNAIGNSLRGAVISANDVCIDASGGARSNVPAITYSCTGGENQAWVLGVDHTLRLQNNLCLDVANGNTSPGAQVIVYSCNNGRNQQWSQIGTQLRSDLSGLCLTSSAQGAQLTMQRCTGAANQNWRLPLPRN